jgi:hypothetical protein
MVSLLPLLASTRVRSRAALGLWLVLGLGGLWLMHRRDPEFEFGGLVALPYLLIAATWVSVEALGRRWRAVLIGMALGCSAWYVGASTFYGHRHRLAKTALDTAIRGVTQRGPLTGIRLQWDADSSTAYSDFATTYTITHEDILFRTWDFVVQFPNKAEYVFYIRDLGTGVWHVHVSRASA